MKPVKTYFKNGQLKSEKWQVNRKLHRLNGPAYQEWYRNGKLNNEEWYLDGTLHRLDGPACQCWYDNSQLEFESWWFNGIFYKKEEHPFILFCKEHSLQEAYEEWPKDMKVLFEVIYK